MSSLTQKEIMLFVKNALKSKDKIKMEKAVLYFNKWKQSQCNYFYDLPDDMIWLISGLVQNDPLLSCKSAKKLSYQELDNLQVYNKDRGITVYVNQLQVGDYIYYFNNQHHKTLTVQMVSRITKCYIFTKEYDTDVKNHFISELLKPGVSYRYNYVNIHNKKYLSDYEGRFKIKNNEKIRKVLDNFIEITHSWRGRQ
jgi:hypothetical protein